MIFGYTKRNEDSKKIRTICKQRKIPRLIHFTRIANLESILDSGLLPKNLLLSQKICFSATDIERLDGHIDGISLSISYPNYRMFYAKTQGDYSKWALVILDPAVLWELDCAFCKTNAANSNISKVNIDSLKTAEAFESLFEPFCDQVCREHLHISPFFPTDPQAEVLVFNSIPNQYISGLCFEQIAYVSDDMRFWANEVLNICIEVGKGYFGPRTDYRFWQTKDTESLSDQALDFATNSDIPF